jgi:tetratricopeptide (TPR) repeat protein
MSSSSSTPPAEHTRPNGRRSSAAARPVLWLLLAIWGFLMSFGLISVLNPPWLRTLSKPGKETEARGYVANGDQLVREQHFREALGWYDRALRADPEFLPARINRAIALGRLGSPEQGMADLRESMARNPRASGVILYNIAELYRQNGDLEQAISNYRQALATGAVPELVYGRLGDAYAAQDKAEPAREALLSALREREDPAGAYRRMLFSVREDEHPDSVQLAAVEKILTRGITNEDLARYDLEFIQSQMERDPERARLLARLAGFEARLGQHAAAAEHLRRAVEIWPACPEAKTARTLLESNPNRGTGPRWSVP